jgi:hypothetical protein
MIKKITTVLIFFIALSINGQQEKINNYKYVIVPSQFSFLKTTDQYQTSSLTKFLLNKKGFTAFLSNEDLPIELLQNRCLALIAEVLDDSGMFMVKNQIQLKDCYGTVLYTSEVGRSKEKNYKKGYHDAIRKAYNSMSNLSYSYNQKTPIREITKTVIKKTIKTKQDLLTKTDVPVRVSSDVKELKTSIPNKIINTDSGLTKELSTSKNVLYAQAIENGFQLVNTAPVVVFQVFRTKVKDVFIIKDKNGILYKNNINWIAEYYNGSKLIVEKYQIKF